MQIIKEFLIYVLETIKIKFVENGGWTSKQNILYLFLGIWALYTFIKNKGWLPKKSVYKKHIFLTGAGSGLGREMSKRFAKMGANLTLVDLNLQGLEETKKLIKT